MCVCLCVYTYVHVIYVCTRICAHIHIIDAHDTSYGRLHSMQEHIFFFIHTHTVREREREGERERERGSEGER